MDDVLESKAAMMRAGELGLKPQRDIENCYLFIELNQLQQ